MAGPATERRAPTCSSASGSKATVGDGRTSKAAAPHDTDRKAADDAATEDEHDTDSDEGDGDAPPRTAAIFLDAPADSTTADCDGSEAAAQLNSVIRFGKVSLSTRCLPEYEST
jgi:hypothetical protein